MGICLRILIFCFFPFFLCAESNDGDSDDLQEGRVFLGSYFASGSSVAIGGIVKGSAYICAGQVIISGVVEGDLLLACGGAEITGVVTGNVLFLGGQLTISGHVGKNITAMAGNIQSFSTARIDGKVVATSSNADLSGEIEGAVSLWVSHLKVGARIHRPVSAVVHDLKITSTASFDAGLNYHGSIEGKVDPKAVIHGSIEYHRTSLDNVFKWHWFQGFFILSKVTPFLMNFFFDFLFGWLLIFLFSYKLNTTISILEHQKALCFGYGVFALLLVPIICTVFLLTISGAPLALALITLNVFGFYTAKIVVILWLTGKIVKKVHIHIGRLTTLVLGLLLYSLVGIIPFVGTFCIILSILLGVGTIVLAQKERHVFLPEIKKT